MMNIFEPYTYIMQTPGKQMGNMLSEAFNYWLKIPSDKLAVIKDVLQTVRTSTTLFDDIEDNSVLRRGLPTAHTIYGIASTMNTASYLWFVALERTLSLDHPKVAAVYTEQLLGMHRGQQIEIMWRDNFTCPTEEEYKNMATIKIGSAFQLTHGLMELFSGYTYDFKKLSEILGLYFQIRDDYCNLCMKEYFESKTYCEDLTEGKFSFPVIHAIHSHPEDNQVKDILQQRTRDVNVKKHCVELLHKFGSMEYTKIVMTQMDADAREVVKNLGGNPIMIKMLDGLNNWS